MQEAEKGQKHGDVRNRCCVKRVMSSGTAAAERPVEVARDEGCLCFLIASAVTEARNQKQAKGDCFCVPSGRCAAMGLLLRTTVLVAKERGCHGREHGAERGWRVGCLC